MSSQYQQLYVIYKTKGENYVATVSNSDESVLKDSSLIWAFWFAN